MKKIYSLLFIALFLFLGYSCDDGSLDHSDVYIPDPVEENFEDDALTKVTTTGDLAGRQAVYIKTLHIPSIEKREAFLLEPEPSWMDDIIQYLQGTFMPPNTCQAWQLT